MDLREVFAINLRRLRATPALGSRIIGLVPLDAFRCRRTGDGTRSAAGEAGEAIVQLVFALVAGLAGSLSDRPFDCDIDRAKVGPDAPADAMLTVGDDGQGVGAVFDGRLYLLFKLPG